MHIYKCTNGRTQTQVKQNILQSQTQKKKNTTTRDKNMTILIGLLRFGEKNNNNNTIFFFYLRYFNKIRT